MKNKNSKPKDLLLGLRRDVNTPYDPLDLRTLAESMVKVVLEQKVYSLGDVPSFEGAGVYVIYYTGGGRKGGVLLEGPAGRVLYNRLKNHADSIRDTKNLSIEDFWCRHLAIKDFFISLCESLLIDQYTPIWNRS